MNAGFVADYLDKMYMYVYCATTYCLSLYSIVIPSIMIHKFNSVICTIMCLGCDFNNIRASTLEEAKTLTNHSTLLVT